MSPGGHFFDSFLVTGTSSDDIKVDVTSSFEGSIQLYDVYSSKVISEVEVWEPGKETSLMFRYKDTNGQIGIRIVNAQSNALGNYDLSVSNYSGSNSIRVGETQNRALLGLPEDESIFDGIQVTGTTALRKTYVSISGYGDFTPSFVIYNHTENETVEEGYDYCDVNAIKSFIPQAGDSYFIWVAGYRSDLNGNYRLRVSTQEP